MEKFGKAYPHPTKSVVTPFPRVPTSLPLSQGIGERL